MDRNCYELKDSMIIFLYGRDSYRLKQNLDKIIEEYKSKHTSGMSFSVLDASEGLPSDTLEKLEDLVKTTSFFNEKRLVIVKNPFLINESLSALIKKWDLAEDKDRIIVCVEYQSEGELNKKDKSFCALLAAKTNVVKNFELLVGKQLENWVAKETAGHDKKIDVAAVQQLISRTGGNPWLLSQEINKLVNYKDAVGGDIVAVADVDLLVVPKEDLNIFSIVDAVANRNRLRAAKLIYDRLESDADSYYIFSMIIYQFRNLLRIKDLANNAVPYSNIIKKTGLNPFVVRKTYEQCKKYDLEELKSLFTKLAGLDLAAKNGETEIIDGLYQFVLAL